MCKFFKKCSLFTFTHIHRESIKEDDEGLVESAIIEIIQKAKRARQLKKRGHRKLGMMRHIYLVIDCSDSMTLPDLKPTRMLCTVKVNTQLFFSPNLFVYPLCSHSHIHTHIYFF